MDELADFAAALPDAKAALAHFLEHGGALGPGCQVGQPHAMAHAGGTQPGSFQHAQAFVSLAGVQGQRQPGRAQAAELELLFEHLAVRLAQQQVAGERLLRGPRDERDPLGSAGGTRPNSPSRIRVEGW